MLLLCPVSVGAKAGERDSNLDLGGGKEGERGRREGVKEEREGGRERERE